MKRLVVTTLLAAACGDGSSSTPDVDAAMEPPGQADASVDAPSSFAKPAAFPVALSSAGPDKLQSVTSGPNGTFYAAGFAAATVEGPKHLVVVKLKGDGTLDTTFGAGDGIATVDMDLTGGDDEIDVAVQPNAKIVVSATVKAAADAMDSDIVVVRLLDDGTLDTGFGDQGKRLLDLSTWIDIPNSTRDPKDSSRSIAVDAEGRIYVHGVQRGIGNKQPGNTEPRTDTDYVVLRLTADGVLDTATFGKGDGVADGKVLRDLYTTALGHSDATARAVLVLPNGSLLASGYAQGAGLGGGQHPVLYKLTSAGDVDPDFADSGVFYSPVLGYQTEVYSGALHGDHIVTAGYGREAMASPNDWVSLRFHAYTGERDMTWGGTTNGASLVVPSTRGSNCRNAIALPNGKTALLGSTGSTSGSTMPQEATFAILDASGKLDGAFGASAHNYDLRATGQNQLWGGAVSGGKALFVGYSSFASPPGGPGQSDTANDDSYAVLLSVDR